MAKSADKAESIFWAALDIRISEDRAAFLAQVCEGNEDLHAMIEEMLRAYPKAEHFLENPAIEPPQTIEELALENPGTRIGPFTLLEQIGEGGMGVVYVAAQEPPVRRQVALKIVKPGMDTRQVIARFEAERQALALMDHPNIAKVFDAGTTESGRPYFVMELIRGIPITDYCDHCNLAMRARLELMIGLCQAVQHAHQKGVIHRDIKPTNVLVVVQDGQPAPKIIDFGIAKAVNQRLTAETLHTGFAQMIGTPLYMSPEQAEMSPLEVDTRGDIYSLGVLLYELITGSTPFEPQRIKEASFDELRRIIREEEPTRPSAYISTLAADARSTIAERRRTDGRRLIQNIRGDLDWITMKCLEKDRTRRYETASALASDLVRFLADEPIQARPPSAKYRLKKFARRRKGTLLASFAVASSVLLLSIVLGWTIRDRSVRQMMLDAEIGSALDESLQWYGQGQLHEARSASQRAKALSTGGQVNTRLSMHIEDWQSNLELAAQLEEVSLERKAGSFGYFDPVGAEQEYRRLFRSVGLDVDASVEGDVVGKIQTSPIRGHLIDALDDWMLTAEPARQSKLLRLAQQADDDPWRNRLRATLLKGVVDEGELDDFANDESLSRQPPNSVKVYADALIWIGREDAAIEILRSAQQRFPDDFWINYCLAHRLMEADPPRVDEALAYIRVALALRPENADIHRSLGYTLHQLGNLAEAESKLRDAVRMKPDSPVALVNLTNLLLDRGHPVEAEAHCREALRLEPGDISALVTLGIALLDQQKYVEAEAAFHKAIRVAPDDENAHMNLGIAFYRQRRWAEAEAEIRRAIQLRPEYAKAHFNLAAVLSGQRRFVEAEAACREAIRLQPRLAQAHCNLAEALLGQQRYAQSEDACSEAIRLDPRLANAHNNLGNALHRQGKHVEAEAAFRDALRIDGNDAQFHSHLGVVLNAQGRIEEAETAYREAIRLDPKLSSAYNNLGNLLSDRRELAEAESALREAIRLDPLASDAYSNLGGVLHELSRLDEAEAAHREAIRRDPTIADYHSNLASVLVTMKRLDKAEAACREALRLQPDYPNAHGVLGRIREAQGRFDEAEAAYQAALRLKPDYTPALKSLGDLLYQTDRIDEAEAAFRQSIRLQPDDAKARSGLAAVLFVQDRLEDADREARQAIHLDPNWPTAHLNLGAILAKQGRDQEAVEALQTSIRLRTDSPETYRNLVILFSRNGQLSDAGEACRELVRLRPDDPQAYADLGNLLVRRKMHAEAEAAYREMVRLAPDNVTSHYNLAWVLDAQSKRADAETAYRQAILCDPRHVQVWYNLGLVLIKLDRSDDAISAFQEAIQLKPEYAKAHSQLSTLLRRERRWVEAIVALEQGVEHAPESAGLHAELAQLLVTCPEEALRNPETAVALANRAVELEKNEVHLQVMGWALYATRQWQASIDALHASCEFHSHGGDCGQWIVLALAHGQQAVNEDLTELERTRHRTDALKWYQKARPQIVGKPPDRNETMQAIRAFRKDAAELLKVDEPRSQDETNEGDLQISNP